MKKKENMLVKSNRQQRREKKNEGGFSLCDVTAQAGSEMACTPLENRAHFEISVKIEIVNRANFCTNLHFRKNWEKPAEKRILTA